MTQPQRFRTTASLLQDLDDLQTEVNAWFSRTNHELQSTYQRLSAQVKAAETAFHFQESPSNQGMSKSHLMSAADTPATTVGGGTMMNSTDKFMMEFEQQQQEQQHRFSDEDDRDGVSHVLNYDALIDDVERELNIGDRAAQHRHPAAADAAAAAANLSHTTNSGDSDGKTTPNVSSRPIPDQIPKEILALPRPENRNQPCHVLVEFKRHRVLQFDSPGYVAPGEYVVVAGDRGEDIGLVTYTWVAGNSITPPGNLAKWANQSIAGKVVRVATVLEISQLQGVQTELENRAKDVAQQKVIEHQLPMRVVDAEYQFDRKKLTFFYQSQHRLDFRNLVRDLYKTFRARIWMELD